ncbi:CRE-SRX-125 protein [Caenorhabditis remanei]|uniref:CRE-SRX-125 protein n=1 Tax=Caenorhabditis remanei TaxID=31234 RepID=E3LP91_CAERE|nr:CRE-SRX-125 protein [Caenorhabditis remanei]
MLELSFFAALLLGMVRFHGSPEFKHNKTFQISLPGFFINIYVFIKLSTKKIQFSGFHKLCITKAVPNSIVCLTFLGWSTPLCAIHPTYATIPRYVNVGFGQVAGWGAYILGPLLQVCMSFNRFYVLYFPVSSMKVSNFPITNIAIIIASCIAVIYTAIGFPEECGFVFDPDILSWRPEDFECAAWLADFIFYSILGLSITSNSLNFATFLKLVSSRSVMQDTLHLIDMINCTILFKLNSAIWYQFVFLSVSFLSIHALDGSVMLYFHTEIHPQWCLKMVKPNTRTGTVFVHRSKISSFHPSA